MQKKIILFLTIFSISCRLDAKKILLCDIGDTIARTNQGTYAIQELGIVNLLLNGLTNNFQFNPKKKAFATLEKIYGKQEEITHEGVAIPQALCDWTSGKIESPAKIRQEIEQKIKDYYDEGFFNSVYEYRMIHNTLQAMFTPEVLVRHQYAIEPMMQLLERIDQEEHTIVIVSNWDQHSYPLFLKSEVGQRLCKLVKPENMIVSGYIGFNKPHPEFYQEIFKRFGNPDQTEYLFIDNEPVNIKAAETHKIPSLHYTGNHTTVEQEFIKQGIIKPA